MEITNILTTLEEKASKPSKHFLFSSKINFTLTIFSIWVVYDLFSTFAGITKYGISIESNPLASYLMTNYGLFYGLVIPKLIAFTSLTYIIKLIPWNTISSKFFELNMILLMLLVLIGNTYVAFII